MSKYMVVINNSRPVVQIDSSTGSLIVRNTSFQGVQGLPGDGLALGTDGKTYALGAEIDPVTGKPYAVSFTEV